MTKNRHIRVLAYSKPTATRTIMKSLLFLTACAASALTLASSIASARELDTTAKNVEKTEVRFGQIGPRDTIIFYTFADQAAVLQLNIAGSGDRFNIVGTVLLFAGGTNSKAIASWINNQHSCGLFPDVPEPVARVPLAANACKVIESKSKEGGKLEQGPTGDSFQDHALKFQITDIKSDTGFSLKGFTADTSVFVRIGPPA